MLIPENPIEGDTLKVEYSPDSRYIGLAISSKNNGYGPFLTIRSFDGKSDLPAAYSIPLNMDADSVFTAEYIVGTDDKFLMFNITFADTASFLDDRNSGDYWHSLIYGQNGLPAMQSNYYRAVSLLQPTGEADLFNINYRQALDYYSEEYKLYPNNSLNELAMKSLMLDLRKISYEKYEQEMIEFIKTAGIDKSSIEYIKAFSRLYKALGMNKESSELEGQYAISNPTSSVSEEFLLSELSNAKSKNDFKEIVERYLGSFGTSENSLKVYSALSSAYVSKGDYSEMIMILDKLPKVPSQVWADLANTMITDKSFMPTDSAKARVDSASSILNKANGVRSEDMIIRVYTDKPRNVSYAEWQREKLSKEAGLLISYGNFYYTVGKDELAYNNYSNALSLLKGDRVPPPLYQQAILTADSTGRKEIANKLAKDAIFYQAETGIIEKFYLANWKKENPGQEDFAERKMKDLRTKGIEKLVEEYMLYRDIDTDSPNAIFSTPDGSYVDTEDWEGEIVVASFISTWCEPCKEQNDVLNEIAQEYMANDKVLVYAISSWEREKDREKAIEDYIKQTNPIYEILIDGTDIIPQKFDVSGLPTTYVMDGKGNIRFKFVGAITSGRAEAELEAAIEYLLQENVSD
ncbi:MAG: hypothetical protein Kapaf2KO_10030 [Candidatus Kapaibacteriales bacterium]